MGARHIDGPFAELKKLVEGYLKMARANQRSRARQPIAALLSASTRARRASDANSGWFWVGAWKPRAPLDESLLGDFEQFRVEEVLRTPSGQPVPAHRRSTDETNRAEFAFNRLLVCLSERDS